MYLFIHAGGQSQEGSEREKCRQGSFDKDQSSDDSEETNCQTAAKAGLPAP